MKRSFTPQIEQLEDRSLLAAAGLAWSLEDSVVPLDAERQVERKSHFRGNRERPSASDRRERVSAPERTRLMDKRERDQPARANETHPSRPALELQRRAKQTRRLVEPAANRQPSTLLDLAERLPLRQPEPVLETPRAPSSISSVPLPSTLPLVLPFTTRPVVSSPVVVRSVSAPTPAIRTPSPPTTTQTTVVVASSRGDSELPRARNFDQPIQPRVIQDRPLAPASPPNGRAVERLTPAEPSFSFATVESTVNRVLVEQETPWALLYRTFSSLDLIHTIPNTLWAGNDRESGFGGVIEFHEQPRLLETLPRYDAEHGQDRSPRASDVADEVSLLELPAEGTDVEDESSTTSTGEAEIVAEQSSHEAPVFRESGTEDSRPHDRYDAYFGGLIELVDREMAALPQEETTYELVEEPEIVVDVLIGKTPLLEIRESEHADESHREPELGDAELTETDAEIRLGAAAVSVPLMFVFLDQRKSRSRVTIERRSWPS